MKYPMRMRPAFKDYLWGGTRLREEYAKQTDLNPVAESWEISCHPDGPSAVADGPLVGRRLDRILADHPDWAGTHAGGKEFPLLIKLIDAKERLSIQVHPDDEYASREEGQPGKNEMWYVVDALPGAELILGLTRPVGREELRERIAGNTLSEILRHVPVGAGDCYQIPAGMLHAIGAGVLVAEIQQNSNVTYRVYDYNRRGADGKLRPLHVDRALDVIDTSLQAVNRRRDGGQICALTDWAFFHTERIKVGAGNAMNLICGEESCHCLLATAGGPELRGPGGALCLRRGESAFLPAGMGDYRLAGKGEVLLTTVCPSVTNREFRR